MHQFGFTGYLAIFLYFAMLLIMLHKWRELHTSDTISHYIFGDRAISMSMLTCSVFNSWIWATSVIGATEATLIYGISGGIAYVGGATIGFILMIIIIWKIQRIASPNRFVTGFIRARFSKHTQEIFLLFSVLITVYIIIEQAVGLGVVFSSIFGISFKKSAFIVMVIATYFVTKAGLRGVVRNDVVNFILILIGFHVVFFYIIQSTDLISLDLRLFQTSLLKENDFINPNVFAPMTTAALKYMVVAAIVGLAQSAMDPIYYLKAASAKNESTFLRGFFIGGVFLWAPFVLLISLVLGYVSYHAKVDIANADFGEILSTMFLEEGFPMMISIAFACFLLCIVMTTIINGLMGIFALASVEIFDAQVRENSDDVARIRFGKMFTWLAGLFCGLIAISLENISLLSIDIFSGIFFSAPCAVLIMGIALDKKLGSTGIVATLAGIVTGLGAWIYMEDSNTDWFYGTFISFLLPILILALVDAFRKERFNFFSLKHEE